MSPAERLRTMQIIAIALLSGVLIFMAIVAFIVLVQNQGSGLRPAQGLPIITIVAGLWLAIMIPMSIIMPNVMIQSALRQMAGTSGSDEIKLWELRQTTLIISVALLEGAAFFGCIAFLLEGHPLAIAAAAAAAIMIARRVPTMDRVQAWIARRADELAELRSRGETYPPR